MEQQDGPTAAGASEEMNCFSGVTDEQNINICCDTKEEKDRVVLNSGGGSSIIGPEGEILAGSMDDGEGVVTAEISLEDVLPGQLHIMRNNSTQPEVPEETRQKEAERTL